MKINANYLNLTESYLFATIAKKVTAFCEVNPDKKVIRLGIGDVTRPLTNAVVDATHRAIDDMAETESFKGYGPYEGYEFLRNLIVEDSYKNLGITADEIYVSDGAKSDMGNIGDIFDGVNTVLISDPVYPVYVDTNIMSGREIKFVSDKKTFKPMPPDFSADIIYLCSPNNPTGAVYTKSELAEWIEYANKNKAVILFDAAYEVFIQDPELPRSIFEILGAKTCAIEFRSFSKMAGFTGMRLGYAVIPKELRAGDVSVGSLWSRRISTKYNGAPYIVQCAGAAALSNKDEIYENVRYYLKNAKLIKKKLESAGIKTYGGDNSPYIWYECGMSSWEYFDYLLQNAQVVGTPGVGFGEAGEGYFRLTAFSTYENTCEALERIAALRG